MRQTNKIIVVLAIFIATFMSAIEGTITSTAMPTIVASLDGLTIMNWVFSIYLLMGAIMTPIYGKLADKYGRKPIFMFGITLFIIGSLSCAISKDMLMLIASRFIQGIGAGAILPISMTIIADLFPPEKRANIIGINNASWGIASIIAPMIGGFLVENFSWRWIFLINVPVGILVLICISFGLKENWQVSTKKPMDIEGTLFLTLILLSFLYFFQRIGENIYASFSDVIVLIFGILSIFIFIRIERKSVDPIISLKLFKSKQFLIINIVTFLISGFLISLDVYVPMWLQLLNNESASRSGMALATMSLMWMVGSFLVGKLISKLDIIVILLIGTLFLSISSIIMSLFDVNTAYSTFVILGLVLGIGFGISMTTTTIAAQEQVEEHELGMATSLNTLFRTIGQSVMVSLYGMTLNLIMNQDISRFPKVNNMVLNDYVNIQTRSRVKGETLRQLRELIYHGLHTIYLLSSFLAISGLILIIALFILNKLRKKKG